MSNEKSSDPGRRTALNRGQVLDAGVALADAEGIRELSMRRLARTLGVEAMSLYNHVQNKDDLIDGMLDRVAGEMELPATGDDWRLITRRRAISAHASLLRHPWAAAIWTTRMKVGPERMRHMDAVLRSLRLAGFEAGLLDLSYHTIENHIIGHAMQAIGFPVEDGELAERAGEFLQTFPVDDYPELAAHIRHHVHQPSGVADEFAFGLDLILDGLERIRDNS